MRVLVSPFRWPGKSREAAELLASGLTWEDTAQRCGVTRRTLDNWHVMPEFQTRVTEHRQAAADAVRQQGIAAKVNRVERLNADWLRMQQVVAERAADESMEKIPGGKTGLVVRQLKSIGFGENNEVVEEFAVDTGLLKELREHEKQAAIELSQWNEKTDTPVDRVVREYIGVNVTVQTHAHHDR